MNKIKGFPWACILKLKKENKEIRVSQRKTYHFHGLARSFKVFAGIEIWGFSINNNVNISHLKRRACQISCKMRR